MTTLQPTTEHKKDWWPIKSRSMAMIMFMCIEWHEFASFQAHFLPTPIIPQQKSGWKRKTLRCLAHVHENLECDEEGHWGPKLDLGWTPNCCEQISPITAPNESHHDLLDRCRENGVVHQHWMGPKAGFWVTHSFPMLWLWLCAQFKCTAAPKAQHDPNMSIAHCNILCWAHEEEWIGAAALDEAQSWM
jgi:hypothetical protein